MSFPGPLATSTTSASAMRWSPFSEISSTWQSIHPAAPTRTGSPDGVRSVFTFLNEPSTRLSATPSIPSARNETANDFDSRTFARVRLSSERANATNGGLNEVCISQVPNIKWCTLVRLRPDHVRAVRDHLQDFLLRLLVHRLTGTRMASAANQVPPGLHRAAGGKNPACRI